MSAYLQSLLGILLSAILTENFILVKFYGICPFMGVSKKTDTALGMGMAVTFVMGIASAATWAVYTLLLVPLDLAYMQTVAFILVIAAVVQGAVLKLMGLTDSLQKEPVSRIQSGLNTLMAAINHGLLEATNGLLDVRTLAGCALTFAGVKSLAVSGAAVPGAMTLLWWAASIWRRNDSGTN